MPRSNAALFVLATTISLHLGCSTAPKVSDTRLDQSRAGEITKEQAGEIAKKEVIKRVSGEVELGDLIFDGLSWVVTVWSLPKTRANAVFVSVDPQGKVVRFIDRDEAVALAKKRVLAQGWDETKIDVKAAFLCRNGGIGDFIWLISLDRIPAVIGSSREIEVTPNGWVSIVEYGH